MYRRFVKLPKNHSFFLFGARGTGKSTLIKEEFESSGHYIDLLLASNEDRYSLDPDVLIPDLAGLEGVSHVLIDEIQKVPKLLDVVHKLIEETDLHFVLTGSSARKLKGGAANLLGGRAFERSLHPLSSSELGEDFDLQTALQWGLLPKVWQLAEEQDRRDFLTSYANTYLKQEVWSEQLIRKLDPFRKFLRIAAQQNGRILNFSNVSRDVGVDPKAVRNYFSILEDTLVGFFLEPYLKSSRKRVHKSLKFYLFDTGVARSLAGQLSVFPHPSTSYFGEIFEQFLVTEFHKLESYRQRDYKFYYLSDQYGEIDLIVERPSKPLACVEIKSTDQLSADKLKKLKSFDEVFPDAEFFCVSRDPRRQKHGRILALHWQEALEAI